jgi:hypothetical protein
MATPLMSEGFSSKITESIENHQRNAKKLLKLSLGEPVKTYAIMLAEKIDNEVIPALKLALYCNDTLIELQSEGIIEDIDPTLHQQLCQGIQTILMWPEFSEERKNGQ